jgi:4-hydroxy-2-oxoheptanedioate aldolase
MPRINKLIDLIESGQQIYISHPDELSFQCGKEMASTWADLLLVDFEHHYFDVNGLNEFMKGLKAGGPTKSGHLTPAVITTLPSNATTVNEVLANAWQSRHVLSTGVHGILNTHTRSAEAVSAFVATCRYPFQKLGQEQIPEGLRGAGGQSEPAELWGMSKEEYVKKADPWPLNPDGELFLGLKIEDRHCVENVEGIAAVPGIAFAEWGPGDMGMSYGLPDAHDPPYPEIMDQAREKIKAALKKNNKVFYSSWNDFSMGPEERIKYIIDVLGSGMVGGPDIEEMAKIGREFKGRKLPY